MASIWPDNPYPTYLELALPVVSHHRWLMKWLITGRAWTSFWLTEMRGKGTRLGEGERK